MDLAVHHQILWQACRKATRTLNVAADDAHSPLLHFPRIVRGSWINDMNQASCFFDMSGAPAGQRQFPEEFFRQLWACDEKELFAELASAMGRTFAERAASSMDPLESALYDVGVYDPADHLDEPELQTGTEARRFQAVPESGLTPNVHRALHQVAATRLFSAMAPGALAQRLTMEKLTTLGRALHAIQDFYAHTNYVELLLWRMASTSRIPPGLVARCNTPTELFEPRTLPRKRFVLRGRADSSWNPRDPVFFAYGASPEETPLTGGEFGTLDTLSTILGSYRRHLMAVGDDSGQEDLVLSLLFGLVDLPRKDLARLLVRLVKDYKGLIESIGGYVRERALELLEAELIAKFPKEKDKIKSACGVIENYDSEEANRWARVGKLAYLQHVIELRLLSKFEAGGSGPPLCLPNHALLSKDYPVGDAVDDLRFGLACYLATKTTTELLVAFFRGEEDYKAILDLRLVHPSHHSRDLVNGLVGVVAALYGGYWREIGA